MMRLARCCYDLGAAAWAAGGASHKGYLQECGEVVRRILSYDRDNKEAVTLMHDLKQRFDIDI
jgi:hypothetical protein